MPNRSYRVAIHACIVIMLWKATVKYSEPDGLYEVAVYSYMFIMLMKGGGKYSKLTVLAGAVYDCMLIMPGKQL